MFSIAWGAMRCRHAPGRAGTGWSPPSLSTGILGFWGLALCIRGGQLSGHQVFLVSSRVMLWQEGLTEGSRAWRCLQGRVSSWMRRALMPARLPVVAAHLPWDCSCCTSHDALWMVTGIRHGSVPAEIQSAGCAPASRLGGAEPQAVLTLCL